MTDLSNLKPPKGATKKRKRVGRGQGSTDGKTSGRGHKGQKARSGGNIPAYFEGGQMPLQRRVPKVGFTNRFQKVYDIVNLADLERVFEEGDTVDAASLVEKGLARGNRDGIKILARGELSKKLTVQAHKFSRAAEEKITSAGGSVEVI